jgi:hypothetical protein
MHIPGGFPRPFKDPETGTQWKFSGHSERVERDIAGRWGVLFRQKGSVVRNAESAKFKNRDSVFMYKRSRRDGGELLIEGKWWRSSGSASVLTAPDSSRLR